MFKQEQLSEEVKKERKAWFWRRITLQFTLTSFQLMLAYSVWVTSTLKNDWTTLSLQLGLIAASVWLVTIYFAAVNDAAKIAHVVKAVGEAVGDAREADKKDKTE